MTEQLKLRFRGHPIVDPEFKEHTVRVYRDQNDKRPTVVSGVWAKTHAQAVVKAAKIARLRKYSIEDSLVIPKIRPKGFL